MCVNIKNIGCMSWNAKNGEKDDEKLPIIIDDGTEIDDIIKGNANLW